jgi:hypothetical protein
MSELQTGVEGGSSGTVTLWRRSDLIRFFGIHERTLRGWIKSGRIPPPAGKIGITEFWHPDTIRGLVPRTE